VKNEIAFADPVKVINFASFLWIGYLVVLTIISQSFGDPRRSGGEIVYYALLGSVALVCVGLSMWTWIQDRLGRAFLPLMITIITVLPILTAWLTMRLPSIGPMLDSESLILRILPFLLVGFLLIAWQYRWWYMLLIVLAIAAMNAGIIWSFPPPNASAGSPFFRGALVIPLIQSVIFLAVGFTISYLMSRLRRQQESLESANVRLTHYSNTLEQLATARERSRLARELHDTLAHTLSGLAVQLETVKAYWEVDREAARSSLERSIDTAHSGLEETRRALKALRATPLDDLGLSGAIKAMAISLSRGTLQLDIFTSAEIPMLSPDVEQAVYRIAQEAITNSVNHAAAKRLTIRLDDIDGKLHLLIRDDGKGFDIEKVRKSSQFGLTGMNERAQLISGMLDIKSEPGKGTAVELTV
jgi:signal transduction histidine kinase